MVSAAAVEERGCRWGEGLRRRGGVRTRRGSAVPWRECPQAAIAIHDGSSPDDADPVFCAFTSLRLALLRPSDIERTRALESVFRSQPLRQATNAASRPKLLIASHDDFWLTAPSQRQILSATGASPSSVAGIAQWEFP